jgi:signal peptidase I
MYTKKANPLMVETSLSMGSFFAILDVLLQNNKPCRIKTICRGCSMAPFIKNNDSVIITPINRTTRLSIGTIAVIAYPKREKVVIHRIIKTKGPLCLIKGDNISTPDGWITDDQIIGRVETVLKKRFSYNCWAPVNFVIALTSRAGIFTLSYRWLSYASRLRRRMLETV